MHVVLASRNQGKVQELQALLAELNWTVASQAEYNLGSPEETGLTFVENALLKARYVSAATKLPAIADDSGLVVPALHGAPGIHSARYAGRHGNDAANNAALVQALTDVCDRRAYFYCSMVFITQPEDPTPLIACASWHGTILSQGRGDHGFGYDPYFLVNDLEQTSAQLSSAEKNRLSHRGQAVQLLLSALRKRG